MGVVTLERTRVGPKGGVIRLCSAMSKRTGRPCRANVVRGTNTCRTHAGKTSAIHKAEGAAALEIARMEAAFGNVTVHTDPGEALLDVVTITRARVWLLGKRLGDAWRRLELLEAEGQQLGEEAKAAVLAGGELALVGYTFSATAQGELYATAEGVRGLAAMEERERKNLAGFAKAALDAKIAERQVTLAERMGEMVAGCMIACVTALGHDPEDERVVEVMRIALEAVTT